MTNRPRCHTRNGNTNTLFRYPYHGPLTAVHDELAIEETLVVRCGIPPFWLKCETFRTVRFSTSYLPFGLHGHTW